MARCANDRIEISQSAAKQVKLIVRNKDRQREDLSAASRILFSVAKAASDPDVDLVIEKYVPISDPDHDLVQGEIVIKFESEDTFDVASGEYVWQVRIEQSVGTSPIYFPKKPPIFEVLEVVNMNTAPPKVIDNLTGVPVLGSVTLQWSNPTALDLETVVLQRKELEFPTDRDDGVRLLVVPSAVVGNTEQFIDTTGVLGTEYFYAVLSQDDSGNWNDEVVEGSNALRLHIV